MNPHLLMPLVVLLVGALAAVLSASWRARAGALVGLFSAVVAGVWGLRGAIAVLLSGETWSWRWEVPGLPGPVAFQVDALSAFFLVLLYAGLILVALYGYGYMAGHQRRAGAAVNACFLNLLAAGIMIVFSAGHALFLLVGWELMSMAAFFLVIYEHERAEVRSAGLVYLLAAHLGAACLLAAFWLLAHGRGSMDFASLAALSTEPLTPGLRTAVFLLALVGFGAKAGLVPLHVWLPEAYAAAPSHVSALMSGVMTKTGFYGLLRVLTLLDPPMLWWAWVLILAGAASGLFGILGALAQQDLKRLLAYSSIENMGIVAMGLGMGLAGQALGILPMAVLGYLGAFLHLLHHLLFKSALFMAAGAVERAAGTRNLDALGGLLKCMPITGGAFLGASAAVAALPTLNGFVGEFVLYLAALGGMFSGHPAAMKAGVLVMLALCWIGALVMACFCKAAGTVFLGEPRRALPQPAHDPGRWMLWPLCGAVGLCGLSAMAAPWLVRGAGPLLRAVTGLPPELLDAELATLAGLTTWLNAGALVLVTTLAGFLLLRRTLLRGRVITAAPTWDCGYAAPSATMQYTGSSFSQPLVDLYGWATGTRRERHEPAGLFPVSASVRSRCRDLFLASVYEPLFRRVEQLPGLLQRLQGGYLPIYMMYVAVTLLLLLVWFGLTL